MIGSAMFAAAALISFVSVRVISGPVIGSLAGRGITAVNVDGQPLPTAAGIALIPGLLLAAAAVSLADTGATAPLSLVIATACGFAILGLIDDLLSDPAGPRGWRGHLGALAGWRLSTGAVKLAGGVALATLISGAGRGDPLLRLADIIVIAGAADVVNLWDTGPGRALICCGAMVAGAFGLTAIATAPAAGIDMTWTALAALAGALFGFWPVDAGRKAMLGDTGAYLAGSSVGAVIVIGTDARTRLLVATVVLAVEALGLICSLRKVTGWLSDWILGTMSQRNREDQGR